MNSRKILYNRILAATLMLLAVALTPLYALAGEIETTIGPTVGFKQGTGAIALDPDNPGKPWEPAHPGEVGPKDDEQAVEAMAGMFLGPASNLDFGKNHSITDYSTTVYPLKAPQRPYIQMADLRGTGTGWSLQVKGSSFVLLDAQGKPSKDKQGQPIKTLDMATIHLEKGTINSSNDSLLLNPAKRPTINGNISILCGDNSPAITVMEAGPDAGMGAWIARWYPVENDRTKIYGSEKVDSKVWLDIPLGSASEGQHKTTLTWILVDAP